MNSEDAKVGMILAEKGLGNLCFLTRLMDDGEFSCINLLTTLGSYRLVTGYKLKKQYIDADIFVSLSDHLANPDTPADSRYKYIRDMFCADLHRLTK